MKSIKPLCLAFLLSAPLSTFSADWEEFKDCELDPTVTYIDGDSIPVIAGDEKFIVNLYFVDAPETGMRYPEKPKEQAEYFGRDLGDIPELGEMATNFVKEKLKEGFRVHTKKAQVSVRDDKLRYYGMIEVDNDFLSELLVEAGLARPTGKTTATPNGRESAVFVKKLEKLEKKARDNKVGAWADPAVAAAEPVVADAPEPVPTDDNPIAAPSAPGAELIVLEEPITVFLAKPEFREAGKIKAGRRIKVLDTEPLTRVLVEVPGRQPVEGFVRTSDLPSE